MLALQVGCGPEDEPVPDGVSCANDYRVDASSMVPQPVLWSLTVDPQMWRALLDDPYEDTFAPCGLSVGGVAYDEGCRIRIRGGSSRDYPKKSFRITYAEGLEHPGFRRKINLRAEYNDPSYLRSLLANQVFTRFTDVPVSRIEPVSLEINGEPYGLMMQVERIGKGFLKDHNRLTEELYESDPPKELHAQGAGGLIPLPDAATYEAAYEKKVGESTGHDRLAALAESLFDDFYGGTSYRTNVDVVEVLDYLAVMAVIQNHDHVRKNYYLSPQANGWEIYPWDLDLTFGCQYDGEAETTICTKFIVDATPAPGVLPLGVQPRFPMMGPFNLLMHLILSDPELAPGFECRVCRIVESEAWLTEIPAQADTIAQMLEPFVEVDALDLNADLAAWRGAVADVRSFPSLRAQALSDALGCAAVP